MKPEQVREKFGPMFCKGLVTMVDEKNGIARIIEICSAKGPSEWDIEFAPLPRAAAICR